MTLRRLAALAAALALALAGCTPSEPRPQPSPALWEVRDDAGKTRGWLFGTIHLLPKGTEWRTRRLDDAIEGAGLLVVEVRDLDPEAVAPAFAALAQRCQCPPLAERLPAADRPRLVEALAGSGMARGALDKAETWAAALTLASAASAGGNGPGADVAVLADFRGRPVVELEGAARQFAIFDRLPEISQRRMLREVVADNQEQSAEALARAWLEGDETRIAAETQQGMMADPVIYAALLEGRNEAWLQRIAPLLASGRRPFVAVGAAHVVGPDGLATRLQAQGFKVRRIQ